MTTIPEDFNLSYLHKEIINNLEEKPYERDVLAKKLDQPRTTIYDYLNDLEKIGVIYKERIQIKRGRPKEFWKLKLEKYTELSNVIRYSFVEKKRYTHLK